MRTIFELSTVSSLLPYLQRGKNNLSVRLSLAGEGQSFAGKSFPFSVINDSTPVTRMVEASLVTDAGSVLKKVFCLLLRDRYLFEKDELQPVTNIDIDTAWQQAFSIHQSEADDSSKTILSCQIDAKGGLNLLSSLFYCRTKQFFFHPPCPKCGLPLQLCKDDNLLILSGLQPFSTSLKRYLYCNVCSSQGVPEFYVNELDHTDPPTLKDRWSLIKEFGLVHESRDPVDIFPCPQCTEHDICYGPGCEAHSRVVPFSFYPFYLLLFESPSLYSIDFLSLVSGAPFDELENHLASRNLSGRINCLKEIKRQGLLGTSLFPVDNEMHFFEVLYLKLSFLGDIFQQLLSRPDSLQQADMRSTVDRIWVKLSAQSSILPSFWNFKTKIIDIVNPPDITQLLSKFPSSNLLSYLGLLWFHVLLVNRKQGNKEVSQALTQGFLSEEKNPSILFKTQQNPIFSPGHIFWDPDGKKTGSNWLPLWERSLDLGFRLFQAAAHQDPQWSYETFLAEFEAVRAEVKKVLFGEMKAVREAPVADCRVNDAAVYKSLMKIIDKWRGRLETEATPEIDEEIIDMTETIILSSAQASMLSPPPVNEEEFTETVILSSKTADAGMPGSLQPDTSDEYAAETVIISPEKQRKEIFETTKSAEESGLTETIILTSPKTRGRAWKDKNG